MKKEDLETGMYAITRNGDVHIVSRYNNELIDIHTGHYLCLDTYNDNFEDYCVDIFDIIRIYKDYTLNNLLWERKELPELYGIERTQLQIFKDLGFTHIKRDFSKDIWLFKDEESICDFCDFFRDIFNTLEEDKRYSIKELLGE